MTPLPTWWLVLSGLFFLTNLVFFVAMAYALVWVVRILRELKPRVDELSGKVGSLVVTVDGIAHRVEELTTTVRTRLDGIGGKTQEVVGSTGLILNTASRQFEKFAPFVTGALTAMRLVRTLVDVRKGKPPRPKKR